MGKFLDIRDEVATLKRDRIVAAAVGLFYERGYENTTLDAVAERLGVTKPFIYAHFGSKADLLHDICSRGIRLSLQAIDSVLELDLDPPTKLKRFTQQFVLTVLKNQMNIAIFTREEKNLAVKDFTQISAMRREFDRKLSGLLTEGIKAGEFKIDDPSLATLAIGGTVSWAYVWYRPTGRYSEVELAEQMSDLILSMVGADTAKTAKKRGTR